MLFRSIITLEECIENSCNKIEIILDTSHLVKDSKNSSSKKEISNDKSIITNQMNSSEPKNKGDNLTFEPKNKGASQSFSLDKKNKDVSSIKLPVTVKTRIGYDQVEDYEHLYNFINILKSTGVKTFIIHARKAMLGKFTPKQNLNIPPLKYEMVYKLKEDFKELNIIIKIGRASCRERV